MRIKHVPTGIAVRCQIERSQVREARGGAWRAGAGALGAAAQHALVRPNRIGTSCRVMAHGSPTHPPSRQALNKSKALEMLKAKLLVVAQEQQLAEVAQIRGDLVKAGGVGWGCVGGLGGQTPWPLLLPLRCWCRE